MGFLDNSGDIILDAVLTDLGRERLARGDGSFKITKFAVADDEIDYGKYNKNNASGSAYYDLDILTTPVLEAFTNNIGSCKHKLMTIPRNNLLYLPMIKLVNNDSIFNGTAAFDGGGTGLAGPGNFSDGAKNMYVVLVDKTTVDIKTTSTNVPLVNGNGCIRGDGLDSAGNGENQTFIMLDQGLDTTKIPNTFNLDVDLVENQYMIELDDRLGKLTTKGPGGMGSGKMIMKNPNFVDDDRIASYYVSRNTDSAYFQNGFANVTLGSESENKSSIAGPRGTRLQFAIRASLELNTSTSLFDRLGGSVTLSNHSGRTFKFIDSSVRITGITTGYRVDVPIRFLKKV